MEKLKVLQVNKAYYPHTGGVEKHVQDVAESLRAFTNVEVEVLVAAADWHFSRDTVNGVSITRLPNFLTLSSAPIAPSFIWQLRKHKADIYHFHFPYPIAEMAYLLSGTPGRLVVTYHSDIVRQKRLLKAYHPFLLKFLGKAKLILTSSPNLISNSPYLSKFEDKCRVVPFAIDVDKFVASSQVIEQAAERRRRYAGEKPVVLFVGRLVYYKGLKYLIEAMKSIDAVLIIVGEGELYSELRAQVELYGLASRIKFIGWLDQDELLLAYHASDMLVLPSVASSEAFGFVQLEAHACGKPVVSTDLPTGVPYANLDGKTGLIVPPANASLLARAINLLLMDERLRNRLGLAALTRVREHFTLRNMATEIKQAYEDVLR